MKHFGTFVFLSMLATACNFVQKELPDSQELLRRELHTIDWNRVDTYPTYATCDSLADAEENKACFFDRLNFEVTNVLKNDSLVQISTIDSVRFLVRVTAQSQLEFKTEQINEKLLPKFMLDSIMNQHQKSFSKVQPAIKRGVPVTTQFLMNVNLDASSD